MMSVDLEDGLVDVNEYAGDPLPHHFLLLVSLSMLLLVTFRGL